MLFANTAQFTRNIHLGIYSVMNATLALTKPIPEHAYAPTMNTSNQASIIASTVLIPNVSNAYLQESASPLLLFNHLRTSVVALQANIAAGMHVYPVMLLA